MKNGEVLGLGIYTRRRNQESPIIYAPVAKKKSFHPFSIANILGNTDSKAVKDNTDTMQKSVMPAPLHSSTPVPQCPVQPHNTNDAIISTKARVEKWVMDNCVSTNNKKDNALTTSPESNRRDILAESFALAVGSTSTPINGYGPIPNGPIANHQNVLKKPYQQELRKQHNFEDSGYYYGGVDGGHNMFLHSECNSSNSHEQLVLHENSFTASESTAGRPGSPAHNGMHCYDEDDDAASSSSPETVGSRRGKKARTSFTAHQLCELETMYRTHRYISAADRIQLARRLKLSDQQVKTWYQNRRMKEKRQIQDLEHAHKFHAAAGAAQAALLGVHGQLHPGMPQVPMPHMGYHVTHRPVVSSASMSAPHHPCMPQHPVSFTQLLNTSPPSALRMLPPSGLSPPMAHISARLPVPQHHLPIGALPIPSMQDIRAVSGQYQMAQSIGAIGAAAHYSHHRQIGHPVAPSMAASAFGKVVTSLAPSVPFPQRVM